MNKKNKIPVKIVKTQNMYGKEKISIMIDLAYYMNVNRTYEKDLIEFKKAYIDTIESAKKIFYGKSSNNKKYQNLSSTLYWDLGNLLKKFNESMKNSFEITNYSEALERDFGLSRVYNRELIIFSKTFKKKEISNNIPMAIYRALIWKKNQLMRLGIFEQEKKRLIKLNIEKTIPSREQYKKELINIIQKIDKREHN